jgi:hypothetical protein
MRVIKIRPSQPRLESFIPCEPCSSLSPKLSQHPPARDELLNGGGWRKLLTVKRTIFVGRQVDFLDAIITQHLQSPGEFRELFSVKNGFGFGAACHTRILSDSLFVRCKDLPDW